MSDITMKLDNLDIIMLKNAGFTHAVVIVKDVSVEVVGSVQSVFRKAEDATAEANRLSHMYEGLARTAGGFEARELP